MKRHMRLNTTLKYTKKKRVGDEMVVLSRNNTMVYVADERVKIKTYFKTIEIAYEEALLESIYQLLRADQVPIETGGRDASFYRALKLLNHCGSVIVFKERSVYERYRDFRWLAYALQVMPAGADFETMCRRIEQLVVTVDRDLKGVQKELEHAFKAIDIKTSETGNYSISRGGNCTLQLHITPHNIKGYYRADVPFENEGAFGGEGVMFKALPIYLTMFVIKTLMGCPFNAFVLDETCGYEEYVYKQNFFASIPLVSDGVHAEDLGVAEINKLENLMNQKAVPIGHAHLNAPYDDSFQMGFSTLGLQMDDICYVYSSSDYESAHIEGYLSGLEFFFNQNSNGKWLATTKARYFSDKLNFLLTQMDEPHEWFAVDCLLLPCAVELMPYMSILEKTPTFYVKRHQQSESFTVYVVGDGAYSDGKKTYDINGKVKGLFFNYLYQWLNRDRQMTTPLVEEAPPLEKEVKRLDLKALNPSETYMEKAIEVLDASGIRYEEYSWQHSDLLTDTGVILREIEVMKPHEI